MSSFCGCFVHNAFKASIELTVVGCSVRTAHPWLCLGVITVLCRHFIQLLGLRFLLAEEGQFPPRRGRLSRSHGQGEMSPVGKSRMWKSEKREKERRSQSCFCLPSWTESDGYVKIAFKIFFFFNNKLYDVLFPCTKKCKLEGKAKKYFHVYKKSSPLFYR